MARVGIIWHSNWLARVSKALSNGLCTSQATRSKALQASPHGQPAKRTEK